MGTLIKSGLQNYWTLNETSGSRADSIGGLTLTAVNSPGSAAGVQGNAMACVRASSQHADSAGSTIVTYAVPYTVVFWLKPASSPGVGTGVMGFSIGAPNNINVLIDSTLHPQFGEHNNTIILTSTPALSVGSWSMVMIRREPVSRLIEISLNDGAIDSRTGDVSTVSATGLIRIGTIVAQTLFFDGSIDEVGIWNRRLSASEITWLYNSGSGRTLF